MREEKRKRLAKGTASIRRIAVGPVVVENGRVEERRRRIGWLVEVA